MFPETPNTIRKLDENHVAGDHERAYFDDCVACATRRRAELVVTPDPKTAALRVMITNTTTRAAILAADPYALLQVYEALGEGWRFCLACETGRRNPHNRISRVCQEDRS